MEAFFSNIILAMCAFIISKSLLLSLIWLPLHISCVVLCRMDTHIFSLIVCKTRLIKSGNKNIWQGVSYEPL